MMTTYTALEISGKALAGLGTIAQLPSTGDGLLESLLKLGAVGVVGLICIILIRENRKTIESIEVAHKDAALKYEKGAETISKAINRLIEHCAAKNGGAK